MHHKLHHILSRASRPLREPSARTSARVWRSAAVALSLLMVAEGVLPGFTAAAAAEELPEPALAAIPMAAAQTPALPDDREAVLNADVLVPTDMVAVQENDSVYTVVHDENSPYGLDGKIPFNPSPTRAVWLSALFPGLGQIYNRRYWKLPIVVGGFMGLGYATNWNNTQLQDYTQAYLDITDSDPTTNSYMNFFPPTTTEDSIDASWLSTTLRSRRDYYRRNRDLCIICMVALYLLCMVDAYVDATLIHFDISDNLALDMTPAVMLEPRAPRQSGLGLSWALSF